MRADLAAFLGTPVVFFRVVVLTPDARLAAVTLLPALSEGYFTALSEAVMAARTWLISRVTCSMVIMPSMVTSFRFSE